MKDELIGGIVRGGVVIPDEPMPEETRVLIAISKREVGFTPEERAEFEEWNRASDRALETFERSFEQTATNDRGVRT